jgi:uncharacterized phage infection (PIP) family protein YhgE
MARIETLNRLLSEMKEKLARMNKEVTETETVIDSMVKRIEELSGNLEAERAKLNQLLSQRKMLMELQDEAISNYKQIDEHVNTILDLFQTSTSGSF